MVLAIKTNGAKSLKTKLGHTEARTRDLSVWGVTREKKKGHKIYNPIAMGSKNQNQTFVFTVFLFFFSLPQQVLTQRFITNISQQIHQDRNLIDSLHYDFNWFGFIKTFVHILTITQKISKHQTKIK